MAGQGSGGNVLAALASFFLPGLGQLLQGRLLAAILFFIFVNGAYGSGIFIFPVLPLAFILHIWCIVNAARFTPE